MWNSGRPAKAATILDTSTGPCIVCGKETEGSPYWVGIGPVPAKFVAGLNQPLCGPACSAAHGSDDDWERWFRCR